MTREGIGSARISWDPVEGATYYMVLYDNYWASNGSSVTFTCSLALDGSATYCDKLPREESETTYVDWEPDWFFEDPIYYFVAACDDHSCRLINPGGAKFTYLR